MQKFVLYRYGNQDGREKTRKEVRSLNQDQIVQRSGIANDRWHLHAQAVQRFTVAFQIFRTVFEFYTAVLEEFIDFHRRLKAE